MRTTPQFTLVSALFVDSVTKIGPESGNISESVMNVLYWHGILVACHRFHFCEVCQVALRQVDLSPRSVNHVTYLSKGQPMRTGCDGVYKVPINVMGFYWLPPAMTRT